MAYKGTYKPKNPNKYIGNSSNIIYRSLWERNFMKYCDDSKNVIGWSSEETVIPYYSPVDKKWHKYYPDFLVKYISEDGTKKTRLIEVKPKGQTVPPKKKTTSKGKPTLSYLRESATFAVNSAKWEAANEYCKKIGIEFVILTEDHLT